MGEKYIISFVNGYSVENIWLNTEEEVDKWIEDESEAYRSINILKVVVLEEVYRKEDFDD